MLVRCRRLFLLTCSFALIGLIGGCPETDPPTPTPPPDAGPRVAPDSGPAVVPDAGSHEDAGPAADAGPVDPPETSGGATRAVTSGGGSGSSENYKVRIQIGSPVTGSGAAGSHKVNLGAGGAQGSP